MVGSVPYVLEQKLPTALASLLTDWVNRYYSELQEQCLFDGDAVSNVNVFMSALVEAVTSLRFDSTVVLLMLCNIRKIAMEKHAPFNWNTVFRMILGSTLIAIKRLYRECDNSGTNQIFASAICLPLSDINALERECLRLHNHDITLADPDYAEVSWDVLKIISNMCL